MTIENLRFKRVMRYDLAQRKLRLFRMMWEANGGPGPTGYSAKAAVSFVPKALGFRCGPSEVRVTLLGVQLHLQRSHGGLYS